MWQLSVNDKCVGSGMCVAVAPEHFRLDHDEQSHPTANRVASADAVVDAAESCPMEAILVTDADTGEVVAP